MNQVNLKKLAFSLALITILGPSAIDMYLPSMPEMTQDLNTSYTSVQLSLTVFLLSMGLGQLAFGPVVDALGRSRPLMFGLLLFIAGAIFAALATSIEQLIIARFIQGMAASLTLVVAMSTVRDVASGNDAARLFALMMTIQGLAPVIAPAIGGYIDVHLGWRAVMLTLAFIAFAILANSLFNLPETLPRDKRIPLRLGNAIQNYIAIASDAKFLWPALGLSSAFFFLFAYIGGAGFVYQKHFGLTPSGFGTVFGLTGLAIMLGAMVSARAVAKLGVARLALRGSFTILVGATISAVFAAADFGLEGIVLGLFIALFGLGIVETTLMSMAMSSQDSSLGSTAALIGGMQLSISSLATPLAAYVSENGSAQWTLTLVVIALFSFLLVCKAAARADDERTSLAGH